MKNMKLTSASVIENPLDVEMTRFIIVEQDGEPGTIEVVIPPRRCLKIRDVLAELQASGGPPVVLIGVCPPGTTEETLRAIGATVGAEMVPVPVPKADGETGDDKAANA